MGFHVFEATVPPPQLPGKVRRGYYTRSVLCEAVKQVMLGTMTVTQAARHFKIPRTTIQKHFSKAREQHNLKEMYIRKIEAAEKGLLGRVPENDLLSYGVDVWPSTEQCEVISDDVEPFQVTTRSTCDTQKVRKLTNQAVAGKEFHSPSSEIVMKPLTRVVLRREGSDEVVKEIVIPRLLSSPQKRSS
ncbi:hypothetical protein GCK32_006674 [Trichostrongylus colubriformis]|uniref:HTH psq-type domain-containing protein n=1 Tax=Trichostrongylus colubriformis TaxID=6319 RepID=A0AAN8F0E7_TRICO